MNDFYERLTPFYHLIHQDWDASVRRQGERLAELIETHWPGSDTVLDVSCGIGTQAIGLALQGCAVTASDLCAAEVARATREAGRRGAHVAFSVCDMREAFAHHGPGFDVVISCDNSLPHLLGDDELLRALRQMVACTRVGGGCLVTLRDYDAEPRGTNLLKPYGVRIENGHRHLMFQVWDFSDNGTGDHYELSLFFVVENLASGAVETHVMRSRYYAVSTRRLCELMCEAGLADVKRLDGVFYQPVLFGTRSA
jgi:SAM-dependent methyltransferase